MTRQADPVCLFESWSTKSRTILLLGHDVEALQVISKFLAEELDAFHQKLISI